MVASPFANVALTDTFQTWLTSHNRVVTTIINPMTNTAVGIANGAFGNLVSTGSQAFSGSNTLVTSANTKFSSNVTFGSNGAIILPKGTTAQRLGESGAFRINVTLGKAELKLGGTWSNVLTGSVSNSQILDGAVGPAEIKDAAIRSRHIGAANVTSNTIATNAVTNTAIASSAVGPAELAASAVVTSKIAAAAVTSAKIDGSVVANAYASNTFSSYDTIAIEAPAAGTYYDFLRKLPRNQDYRTIYYSTHIGSANVGFWVGSTLVANVNVSTTANTNSISVTGKTGDRVYIHLYDGVLSTTANLEFSFGG